MSRHARRVATIPLTLTLAGAVLLWLRDAPDDTIRLTGTVVSLARRDILSPIDARVLDVHARVGDDLNVGDSIMSLDLSIAEAQARLIEQDLVIRNSDQLRAQLALQGSVTDVDAAIDRTTVELRALNDALANRRRQLADGQDAAEQVETALLAVQQAEFALGRLQEERWRLKQDEARDVDTVAAARRALMLTALENRALLNRGAVRAVNPARIVALLVGVGDSVTAGQVVARVDDHSAFGVRVTLSDELVSAPKTITIVVNGRKLAAAMPPGPRRAGELVLVLENPSLPELEAEERVEVWIRR